MELRRGAQVGPSRTAGQAKPSTEHGDVRFALPPKPTNKQVLAADAEALQGASMLHSLFEQCTQSNKATSSTSQHRRHVQSAALKTSFATPHIAIQHHH